MEYKEIKHLSETGHPRETAEAILQHKAKGHISSDHRINVHKLPDKEIIKITVKEAGKIIAMKIDYEIGIQQAHKILYEIAEKNKEKKKLEEKIAKQFA